MISGATNARDLFFTTGAHALTDLAQAVFAV